MHASGSEAYGATYFTTAAAYGFEPSGNGPAHLFTQVIC